MPEWVYRHRPAWVGRFARYAFQHHVWPDRVAATLWGLWWGRKPRRMR